MIVTMRNEIATPSVVSISSGTSKALEWSENDEKMVLVINNEGSSSAALTVKAGNGIMGVTDLALTVPQGISLVKLESSRFKNVSGENKGKIVVQANSALKIGVAALV